MILTPVLRRILSIMMILGAGMPPLAAQNILFTDRDGKFLAVREARGNRPLVEVNGKMVLADGKRFALQKTEDYLPVFISVRELDVKTHYVNMEGAAINHDFIFRARLETPYQLDDVFIVLELDTETAGKVLYLQEVGKMEARHSRLITATVRMPAALGDGRYYFHLFSGGREVLHSEIPPLQREVVVDRMTARRIAGVKDAAPALFVGPTPEYPSTLLKSRAVGQAIISARIGANGRVMNPAIKSATDPAFGQSALAAVRLWRFLPQVKAGRPVETEADIPFDFAPPAN